MAVSGNPVRGDYKFGVVVRYLEQVAELALCGCFIVYPEGYLDINPFVVFFTYKINLLGAPIADLDRITPIKQVVVDKVFQ